MFLMALLEEKESMEREDVEGRRKKEEAKRLLEAGMRRIEGGRDWGEAAGVKGEEEECEKLREMLDWMKAEVGR